MTSSAVSTVRRWWQRGSADHGWLKTYHSFSFASYYDPQWVNFGCLRVVNEDRVAPRTGFPTHPHANAEIFSYIIDGKLTHKDSMGNVETLRRGEVQFTSAGKGIRHSEYNDDPKDTCHFMQIWYIPRQRNLPPKYYTLPQVDDAQKTDQFMTLIRDIETFTPEEQKLTGLLPPGRAIPAHCSLTTRTCILTPGQSVVHTLGQESNQSSGERWAFLHLAMTGGWKDPAEMEQTLRRDLTGYSEHKDRLAHAARFVEAVYGVAPPLDAKAAPTKLAPAASSDRPRVLLTYAQSRDGRIAGANKKMLALSNAESMIMTHTLRTLFDGILIGVGTLLNDNPQLNARLLNPLSDGSNVSKDLLPRPIVLDTHLRTQLDCKLLQNAQQGFGKTPLILTSTDADVAKGEALQAAGAEVIRVATDSQGHLSWPALLTTLRQEHNINSVMVEGGATVIESLFAAHAQASLIDELIVTVSPTVVGQEGLAYRPPAWVGKALPPQSRELPQLGANENALVQLPLTPQLFQRDNILTWSSARPSAMDQEADPSTQAQIRVGDAMLIEGDGVFLRGGQVGETIEITNTGHKKAEFLLFDLEPSEEEDD